MRWSSSTRCSQGALEARGKVLVKLNVDEADLDAVIALLPSMKSPTVSKLFGDGGYAVETVVPKRDDQHAHPGAEGRRRHRHHRAADLQDRPLTDAPMPRGVVVGLRRGQGLWLGRRTFRRARRYFFHCTQIADGTRSIPSGADVEFDVGAGRQGRWEAMGLRP